MRTKSWLVFVHKDPGTSYGLSFPDAPGCITAADSWDELFARARAALAFHLEGLAAEGLPAPRPRPLDAIMSDPDLAEERSGATAIMVLELEAA